MYRLHPGDGEGLALLDQVGVQQLRPGHGSRSLIERAAVPTVKSAGVTRSRSSQATGARGRFALVSRTLAAYDALCREAARTAARRLDLRAAAASARSTVHETIATVRAPGTRWAEVLEVAVGCRPDAEDPGPWGSISKAAVPGDGRSGGAPLARARALLLEALSCAPPAGDWAIASQGAGDVAELAHRVRRRLPDVFVAGDVYGADLGAALQRAFDSWDNAIPAHRAAAADVAGRPAGPELIWPRATGPTPPSA